MTLREIFSSIGSFIGKLWNGFLDADILFILGSIAFFIVPLWVIHGALKKNSHKFGAWIFSFFMFCIWVWFVYTFLTVMF